MTKTLIGATTFLLLSATIGALTAHDRQNPHVHEAPAPAVEETCPPECAPSKPGFEEWWCGEKKIESDCVLPDQVQCKWKDNACVPAKSQ